MADGRAPESIKDQRVHSWAFLVSEWSSQLLVTGGTFDASVWLQEGVGLLVGCAESALEKFGESHLEQFETLTRNAGTAIVGDSVSSISKVLDEFLLQLDNFIHSLDEGSKVFDQPLALIDKARRVLSI